MTGGRASSAVALGLVVAGVLAGCGGGGKSATHGGGNLPPGSTLPSGSTTPPSTTTSSGSAPTGTTTPAGGGGLTVSPSPAHPRSEIAFGFTAPAASGDEGKTSIGYSLSVTGPAGKGCVGVHEASGPSVTKGQQAKITLGPAELKSPWCAGAYTARVFELARAVCSTGQACPQYIRVVAVVGKASFQVTAGG